MSTSSMLWDGERADALAQTGSLFSIDAVRHVLTAFLATRLIVFGIILLSSTTIPMRQGEFFFAEPDNMIVDGLVRYDSWWYSSIIENGYSTGDVESGVQGNIAFFPLYPMLIQLVMAVSGSSDSFLPAILISNAAFLLSLFYLYALMKEEFDGAAAARTVFYLAAAPTSLFFSAVYTEGLYTLLIAGTFYYSRQGSWLKAALFGALAAATRNTGIISATIIALEGLHQNGFRLWPSNWSPAQLARHISAQFKVAVTSWPSLVAALFVGTGLLAYVVYLNSEFGDPIAFITVQETWGREIGAGSFLNLIPNTIREFSLGANPLAGEFNPSIFQDALITLLFIPILVLVTFRMRPAYAVFCWATFLIPLSTGTVISMSRYVLMLLPCFMLLGHWGRRPWLDRMVLAGSLPLMAYVSVLFSHWYFAG